MISNEFIQKIGLVRVYNEALLGNLQIIMKYLVGAQANQPKNDKNKDRPAQQLAAAPNQSPNSGQSGSQINLRKKVKKKTPPAQKPAKGSITTRGDTMTKMSSKCPSNYSFFKSNHRFERLKKEVAVKNEDGRCMPITTNYEIVRLRGSDKKSTFRFYCFPDEMLDIRPDLRTCLRNPATVDFDVQSTDGQIDTSVSRLTKQLKQAIEENRKISASNNPYYLP